MFSLLQYYFNFTEVMQKQCQSWVKLLSPSAAINVVILVMKMWKRQGVIAYIQSGGEITESYLTTLDKVNDI